VSNFGSEQRGEPMEALIDYMRTSIHVEVNTSRNDITNGFNITYLLIAGTDAVRSEVTKCTQNFTGSKNYHSR
jgi:hypothetical protein